MVNHDRARRLAEAAENPSVSPEWLTGSGGHPSNSYLYDEPALEYLEAGEQPHLVLYNERKGLGIDEKDSTIAPDPAGITLVLVTDLRVLVIVGKETGDESVSLPHDSIAAVEYETGILKNRVTIETENNTYHIWVNSGASERELAAVGDLVGQFRSGATAGESGSTRAAASDGSGRPASTGAPDPSAGATGTGAGASGTDDEEKDPVERLEQLKELNEQGIITDEEFREKKSDLLDEI